MCRWYGTRLWDQVGQVFTWSYNITKHFPSPFVFAKALFGWLTHHPPATTGTCQALSNVRQVVDRLINLLIQWTSVCRSRSQAKDHGLGTVQRCCVPGNVPWPRGRSQSWLRVALTTALDPRGHGGPHVLPRSLARSNTIPLPAEHYVSRAYGHGVS